ncbi:DUF5689 domain-containing protein [Soonwooa purpurea]
MKINSLLKTVIFSVFTATALTSCVKNDDWETPPIVCNNKFDAPTMSMADFAALAPSGTYKIPVDGPAVIFDAYIVSSDEYGNFYKTISIQDKPENPTVGLSIEVDKSSNYADFPIGAHVRIKANGLVLGVDRGTKKIGSVDPQYAIGRIPSILFSRYIAGVCNGNGLDIAKLVPTKVKNLTDAKADKYLNTLVTVPKVQFADTNTTFIDYSAGIGIDTDRKIVDATGGSTVLRNSGYCTFGSQIIPSKSGDVTFVVSRYNANFQMYIRGLNDINFTEDRFVPTEGGGNEEGGNTEAANFLFKGADFESWSEFISSINSGFGIKPYATQGVGLGRENSNALQIKGTPAGNDYVFTAIVNNPIPANAKKITFYVKGTSGKSLSLNVNKPSGTPAYTPFNVGALTDKNVILKPAIADGNQYNGAIDTKGKWVLITLNIEGLEIQTAAGKDLFSLKTGKDAAYDLVIDNIKID